MAGSLVRLMGMEGSSTVAGLPQTTSKRAIFVLSDGTRAAISCDPNQTGVTGDGGDNTGVAKFYVYTSPDGISAWTLRATITPTASASLQQVTWAACIGSNNNLHLCWRTTAGGIAYRLITFGAGPTYTAGSEETVLATNPANSPTGYVRRLDIDVAGSANNAVIASYGAVTASATVSNRFCEIRLFTRSNTPAWVAAPATSITSGGQWNYTGSEDICITADAAGPDGSNNINCIVFHTRKRNDGGDLGDMLWIWRTNVATGTSVSITANTPTSIAFQGINVGTGGGIRTYNTFASGNGEFTIIGLISITPAAQVFIWRFTVSSGGVRTDLIARQVTNFPNNQFDRTGTLYGWGGASYGNDSGVVHARTASFIYGIPIQFFRTPVHSARVGSVQYWDEQYTFGGPRALTIQGVGNNRNFSFNEHDVIWFSSWKGATGSYRSEAFVAELPATPKNVTPAASATITTDRPIIAGDHNWSANLPQTRTKMTWQIASDAGFSTNLRTITEADADFILALNTASPNNAKVTTTELTTALSELFQGTWYIRARSVTELGDVGAWSSAQSFVVTHPPSAVNTFPRGDAIFDYGGSGNITFSWTFSDPSPYDSQTAYQIIVEDAVAGTSVLDTGKVTSTVQSATQAIPIGGKDIQLRWKIRLWDTDDVAGNYSTYQTFFTVDKPAIVVNFPGPTGANELTADDSSATTTVGTWSAITNAAAPTRNTVTFRSTPGSVGSSAVGAGSAMIATGLYPVFPGEEITLTGYSRAGTVAKSAQMVLQTFDVSSTLLQTVLGTTVTDSNSAYTQLPAITQFVPQGVAFVKIGAQRVSMGAGETFTLDDFSFNTTGNINTATPVIQWTTTIGGGRTQTNYRVVITQGSTIIYDSGWILSSANSHAVPIGYLFNTNTYTVTVSVRDSLNLENSTSAVFTTSWALPASPSFAVDATNYETLGYVRVSWTNAAIDADFIAWNVYRRPSGTTTWTLIDQKTVDASSFTSDDYLAGSGIQYEYTVTQLVDRFGSLVESLISPTLVTPVSTVYWLIHPVDSSKNTPLRNVSDDPHTYQYDSFEMKLIGRGRKIDYGDRYGVEGQLTAKLRDISGGLTARNQRENLLVLRDEQRDIYLRNPFGDVWLVAMGDISVGRIAGVGLSEYVDLSIPYTEVAP